MARTANDSLKRAAITLVMLVTAKAYSAKSQTSPLAPFAIQRRDVGPYDVQIEILYCGVCHSDLHQVRNEWHNTIYPSTSPNKTTDALRLGAHEVVVSKNETEMKNHLNSFDFILDAVSAQHDVNAYLELLKVDGTLTLVGAPEHPLPVASFPLLIKRRRFAGSIVGGIRETEEMLDFCAEHGITADIELIQNPADQQLLRTLIEERCEISVCHRHGFAQDGGYDPRMISRFRVSSLLPRKLEELGLSLPVVLRHAGLPMGLFNQERILVTTEEFFALWRSIAEVSPDPAIGLKIGNEQRIERYDPIAIAALYTRSFRDALQRLARYKQLTCPEEVRLTSQGDECSVQFGWLLARESEPALLIDVCFAWIVAIGRRGTGSPVTPLRVELTRAPAYREILEDHYGCRVKFKSNRNALVFRKSDLDRPFVTHNGELLAMLAPQLEAELNSRRSHQTIRDQVKNTLKPLLAGQRPSILEVARELNLSARTLQRRLTEAGLTFQQVLEEARRELARHYLLQSSLELNEAAYLLGYESANSFFRAFRHWEGTSPGQWRDDRRQANTVAPTVEPATYCQ